MIQIRTSSANTEVADVLALFGPEIRAWLRVDPVTLDLLHRDAGVTNWRASRHPTSRRLNYRENGGLESFKQKNIELILPDPFLNVSCKIVEKVS